MGTVLRVLKAVVLAVMMFFSLRYLGFNTGGAAIFSLVPLLLGILNVFTSFAYGLTGSIFILASGMALMPDDWKLKMETFTSWIIQDIKKDTNVNNILPAPEPTTNAERASNGEKSSNSENHENYLNTSSR